MVRIWFPTFLSVFLVAAPALAGQVGGLVTDEIGSSTLTGQIGGLSAVEIGPSIVLSAPPPATRGRALPLLYGTLAGLQAYDGWSTLKGTNHGVSETNPLLGGGVASNPGAVWALKAGSTAASIYFAESLWRHHHRTQAIVMMVVVNGAMAAVAARNSSVIRGLK